MVVVGFGVAAIFATVISSVYVEGSFRVCPMIYPSLSTLFVSGMNLHEMDSLWLLYAWRNRSCTLNNLFIPVCLILVGLSSLPCFSR